MTDYQTEQEEFWVGDFGDEYVDRNKSERLLAANLKFFADALNVAGDVRSVVEFGGNVGMNLRALKLLFPEQEQFGIEINAKAAEELRTHVGAANVFHGSIFDFVPQRQYDLALIKGVLIHIKPEMLASVYDKLHAASKRFILICEYYNPVPVSIVYRGHEDRLFKRDFCGEMLDRFADLRLVDYGFAYKRDPAHSQDDITWFLLEKRGRDVSLGE